MKTHKVPPPQKTQLSSVCIHVFISLDDQYIAFISSAVIHSCEF